MRYWLVGSFVLLVPCFVWAQEKPCPVEATQLTLVKQTRDVYERRVAELAVQVQQLIKDKQSLERQIADLKSKPERE